MPSNNLLFRHSTPYGPEPESTPAVSDELFEYIRKAFAEPSWLRTFASSDEMLLQAAERRGQLQVLALLESLNQRMRPFRSLPNP